MNMHDTIATIRGKLFSYRAKLFAKNIIIGDGLKLFCKLSIKGKGRVIIGNNCLVRGIPGSRTQFVTLFTNSPEAELRIGDSAQLLATKISCHYSITIGNGVLIEDSSILDSDFHSLDISRGRPANESKKNCAILIHDNVAIGARSVITKGVKLGKDTLIAPCSVVQHSFPAGSFLLGNPAKPVME